MISVSVIIPTHNRSHMLRQTIASLCKQDMDINSYEIIIVDNASTDETKKVAEEFKDKSFKIQYIYEPILGLHYARHAGAKAANGEILLYLDDDVIADKNLISEIIKFYNDEDVGCVGGRILPKWEVEPPDWVFQFPKWYLSILDDEDGPKEVQWIYGCNFSIRKDLLFEVGGFNPDAFGDKRMWWFRGDGEIGLLRKVHKAGKKAIYNPKAIVWHFIPKKRITVEYFKERAFKSGIEASFSKYRYNENSFNPTKLFLRASAFGIYNIFHNILGILPVRKSVKHKVTSSYYKARCFYELKLAVDKRLGFIIKSKNWL